MLYDTFTFFNELELLDVRLRILDDVVDKFVLVEADRTFLNTPKPLYFEENKSLFSRYGDKIIHVVVEDMPIGPDAWQREFHQRNCIGRGLTGCAPDDVIVVTDLDEIPNPEALRRAMTLPGIKLLEMELFYYFMNCRCIDSPDITWGAMCNYGDMPSPQALRNKCMDTFSGKVVPNTVRVPCAGWHFSYLGGVERIQQKITSFSEGMNEHIRSCGTSECIRRAMEQKIDLYGRDMKYEIVPFETHFPDYLRQAFADYPDLICEDEA